VSAHTPGPWKCSSDYAEIIPTTGPNAHVELARVVGFCDGSSYYSAREQAANARLIATAPDLLAALELALATIERIHPSSPFDSTQGTRDIAKAAIAKAKGVTP